MVAKIIKFKIFVAMLKKIEVVEVVEKKLEYKLSKHLKNPPRKQIELRGTI